jgi:ADP-ribose pyrophosphatase
MIKILDEKEVYQGYLKVTEATIEHDQNGTKTIFENSKVTNADGVAALLWNNETKKFIFVQQYRYPINNHEDGNQIIEIPAGKIDHQETPLEAIKREIKEETGYDPKDIEEIMEFYPSPGCLTERVYLFLCIVNNSDKTEKGGGLISDGEFIKTIEIPLQNIYDILDQGGIRDAKTIIAIQEFRIKHQMTLIDHLNDSIKALKEQVTNLETKLVVLTKNGF